MCPPCPLARVQMARALGPTCTPRPLGQPGLTCPQAPAQRSRDKYTRTPCVPAGRFARQAPVGTALRGRLPAPPRPLGDSLQPRRAPHTASRGPSPGRRRPPDPPGPPRAPRPRGASPRRDSTPSSELSPECRVPSPAPERAGVGSPGRGGRPRGLPEPGSRRQGRAGAEPWRGGRPGGTCLDGGDAGYPLRQRRPLCSRQSPAAGDEGRPAPPPARPPPANPRRPPEEGRACREAGAAGRWGCGSRGSSPSPGLRWGLWGRL